MVLNVKWNENGSQNCEGVGEVVVIAQSMWLATQTCSD